MKGITQIEVSKNEKELAIPKEILEAFKSNTTDEILSLKNDSFINFDISQSSAEKEGYKTIKIEEDNSMFIDPIKEEICKSIEEGVNNKDISVIINSDVMKEDEVENLCP